MDDQSTALEPQAGTADKTARARDTGSPPGLVVLSGKGVLLYATAEAQRFLKLLPKPSHLFSLAHRGWGRFQPEGSASVYRITNVPIERMGAPAFADDATAIAVVIREVPRSSLIAVAAWIPELTPRERDLYLLLLQGYSSSNIAKRLNLSAVTVKKYTGRIFTKAEVTSRAELISKALHHVLGWEWRTGR